MAHAQEMQHTATRQHLMRNETTPSHGPTRAHSTQLGLPGARTITRQIEIYEAKMAVRAPGDLASMNSNLGFVHQQVNTMSGAPLLG